MNNIELKLIKNYIDNVIPRKLPISYNKTTLNGNDYNWSNKNILNDGTIALENNSICSESIEVGKNTEAIFTGATTLHDKDCIIYIIQFSDTPRDNSSYGFIKKSLLYSRSTGITTVKLEDNCKYIKFIYQHDSSENTDMPINSKTFFKAIMQYSIDIVEIENKVNRLIEQLS